MPAKFPATLAAAAVTTQPIKTEEPEDPRESFTARQ
jgi:hypothetical protein